MAHPARLVGGALVGALLLAGCSIPEAPDLWHSERSGPPAAAPAAADWAFVAAGAYGQDEEDEDDGERGQRLQGATTVHAGWRGEGSGEREFDLYELEQARFRGFSAPQPSASFEGPRVEPPARAPTFQPLREVPR